MRRVDSVVCCVSVTFYQRKHTTVVLFDQHNHSVTPLAYQCCSCHVNIWSSALLKGSEKQIANRETTVYSSGQKNSRNNHRSLNARQRERRPFWQWQHATQHSNCAFFFPLSPRYAARAWGGDAWCSCAWKPPSPDTKVHSQSQPTCWAGRSKRRSRGGSLCSEFITAVTLNHTVLSEIQNGIERIAADPVQSATTATFAPRVGLAKHVATLSDYGSITVLSHPDKAYEKGQRHNCSNLRVPSGFSWGLWWAFLWVGLSQKASSQDPSVPLAHCLSPSWQTDSC